MSRFYVTTAIPYVNASPHLGHALEFVQADVLARVHRLAGDEVRFLSGTDDHALTNVLAAEAAGVPVAEYVEARANEFAALRDPLRLSLDDYIQTSSDPRHRPGVERLWRAAAASGDLYLRDYEGSYCVRCEQFYQPQELTEGLCPEHRVAPETVAETNWFFRLSRHARSLLEAIESGRLRIEPVGRRNEVVSFIRSGLDDISVSRTVRRARGWGIPVPGDPSQVIYVWFDALANYITSLGYGTAGSDFRTWWLESDERVHVIGKGILRFHAVYWPAFLLSAGEPLPTAIYVHEYLTVDGAKISKSTGNTVDPAALLTSYGSDALRWWLAADVSGSGDTDFTEQRLIDCVNQDLANGYGNLVSRIATLVRKHRPNGAPQARPVNPLADSLGEAQLQVVEAIDRFDIRRATIAIRDVIHDANAYIEQRRPWEQEGADFDQTVGCLVAVVAYLAELLEPFVPDLASRAQSRLTGDASEVLFPRVRSSED